MGIGFPQEDMIIHTAITAALDDIKKNPYYIDDICSQLISDPLLNVKYGANEIKKFKDFMKKKFYVAMVHRLEEAKFPSISIAIGPGQEDSGKAALGDIGDNNDIDPATLGASTTRPQIVIGPVTPIKYDPVTGTISFDDDVVLDNVYSDGMVVFDEINKISYPISLVLDSATILIDPGSHPNLTGMTIRLAVPTYKQTRGQLFFFNTYEIGVHAQEATEVIYLFQIVMFILLKYKKTLFEARGLEITTISYGGLERFPGGDDSNANIIYQRTISFRGRVGVSWPDDTNPGISGLNPTLRIDGMTSPAAVLTEVDMMGWRGSGDE